MKSRHSALHLCCLRTANSGIDTKKFAVIVCSTRPPRSGTDRTQCRAKQINFPSHSLRMEKRCRFSLQFGVRDVKTKEQDANANNNCLNISSVCCSIGTQQQSTLHEHRRKQRHRSSHVNIKHPHFCATIH